jgi:hypothetical protein
VSESVRHAVIRLVDEKGGLEPIYERLAGGEALIDIAKDYTPAGREKPLSRTFFYWMMTRTPELKEAYQKALEVKADHLVEEGMKLIDDAALTREAIQKADAQAKFRIWFAGKLNRKTYGDPDKQGVQVVLNIETLHLDALRKSPANVPALPAYSGTALPPVKEAIIISEDEHGSEDHAPSVAGGQ